MHLTRHGFLSACLSVCMHACLPARLFSHCWKGVDGPDPVQMSVCLSVCPLFKGVDVPDPAWVSVYPHVRPSVGCLGGFAWGLLRA
jgi:hypothetical protein